jgi:hypothetical protein
VSDFSKIIEDLGIVFTFGFQGEFYAQNFKFNDTSTNLIFDKGHEIKTTGSIILDNKKTVYSFGEDGRVIRWKFDTENPNNND